MDVKVREHMGQGLLSPSINVGGGGIEELVNYMKIEAKEIMSKYMMHGK